MPTSSQIATTLSSKQQATFFSTQNKVASREFSADRRYIHTKNKNNNQFNLSQKNEIRLENHLSENAFGVL